MPEPEKQIAPNHVRGDGPPTPTRRKLGAGVGAATLVLLVGLVAAVSVGQLITAFKGVEHSTHVISELRRVSASLLDAESSVRGYIMAPETRFITRYESSLATARADLRHLRHEVEEHPDQARDVDALRAASEAKVAAMQHLLATAGEQGSAAAARRFAEGVGWREMDDVRAIVARMTASEEALLARRSADRERNTRLALIVIGGGSAIAFLLLAGVLAGVHRELSYETRTQRHLLEQTQRLDAQATELELQNEQLHEQAVALEEQSAEMEAQQTELEATNDELLRANTEVESARERFRLILESTDAGIYGINAETLCTFINPAASRMLGYEPDELIGEPMHVRAHHTRPDGTPFPIEECPIAGTLRTATTVRTDAEVFWRKDGSYFHVDYAAAPVVSDGVVTGVVVTFVDVSHRKRSEQTREFLAEATRVLTSSLDYEQTLRTVADLAVPRLGDWCVVDVLEGEKQLRRLALVHRDPDKLHLVEDLSRKRPPRLDASIGSGKVLRTGEPELYTELPRAVLISATAGDAEQLRAIDTLEIRSLMSVPIVIRGKPAAAIVSAMAESGRRFTEDDLRVAEELARRASIAIENAMLYREAEQARHRAEAADRAKSEFLAAMSHELRTPLNAISGYTELLQVGVHGPVTPKQREALERIQRSQKTLLALINDILNFSKLRAGFIEVQAEDVRVEEILTTIDAWVEPQLQAKSLRYHYDSCAPELVVRGDREKIQQVMLNLLSNAVKFTPAGGEISVRCETGDGTATILVTDTGPGIPEDKREAIFEPFVQIDRDSGEGTGLGLAISRDLARAMHGDLRVESKVGEGSTFLFSLPTSPGRGTR